MADKEIARFGSELGGQVIIFADTVTGLVTGIATNSGTAPVGGGAGVSAFASLSDKATADIVGTNTGVAAVAATATAAQVAAANAASAASSAQTVAGTAASAASAAQTTANSALKGSTNWAAGTNTPTLTSGTAVLGASYKNTTAGTTTLGTPIDGITQVAQGDILLCFTAGTYTLLPVGGAYLGVYGSVGALPAAASNAGNSALVGTTLYFCNGAAWAPPGTTPLAISGTATVGSTLTAALASGWAVTGYQWSRNGVPISGATSATYLLVSADTGNSITCAATGLTYVSLGIAVPGVAPGAVTGVTAGAATASSQVLTWTAPSTGSTPITYNVGFRLTSAGGAYTSFATGVSALTATVTGLTASTAYDYQVTPVNATGSGPAGLLGNASTGAAVTLTMTQLDANRVISRTTTTGGGQSKGQGTVPVAITLSATSPVYARRRSASDGTTILQTPWLVSASTSTGTVSVTGIDVPAINSAGSAPVAANDGWFYLDLAPSASGPWTNGTSSITCGRLIAISGQSLAVRMLGHQDGASGTNTSLSVTITPYCSMLATYNDTRAYMPTVSTMPWAPPADGGNYDSTFTSEFLRRQVQSFGCPAGVIGHAQGGTTINTFFSGGANDTQFAAVTARAGGAWEAGFYYQGHTEAAYGLPDQPYAAALASVWTRHAALNTLTAAKYTGSIPNIGVNNQWGTPFERRAIRKAHATWAAGNSATHVQMSDITQIDTIHENQVGAIVMAQHVHRATKAELGQHSDLGPVLLSATRVGTTITATLSDVGQSTLVLTGTPGNRIHVFSTGRYDSRIAPANNRFPVSSVTVTNKTTLSIVLANDPGDGHALDLYFYWPNELGLTPANDMIRDDVTDGDGITVGRQVVPNYASIQIAPPGSGVNAPPSGFIAAGANSPFNLTPTSATFGAQEQTGFNGTMSGGTAQATANSTPAYVPYAVEFWFTCPTIPASTQVMVGGIGGDFVGLTSAGKLTANGGGGSVTLVAGKRYAVCYQRGPSGTQLFLQNITDATAGVRDINNATAVTPAVGAGTFGVRNHLGSFALSGGTVDEVAYFQALRYPASNTTYTAPTTPFTGAEANLVALYHLDGDVTEAVAW